MLKAFLADVFTMAMLIVALGTVMDFRVGTPEVVFDAGWAAVFMVSAICMQLSNIADAIRHGDE